MKNYGEIPHETRIVFEKLTFIHEKYTFNQWLICEL